LSPKDRVAKKNCPELFMKSHLYVLVAFLCTHSAVAAELDRGGGDKAMKTDDGNAAPICGSDLDRGTDFQWTKPASW
jgi:hypothetical protein